MTPPRITVLYEPKNWIEPYMIEFIRTHRGAFDITTVTGKDTLPGGDICFYFNVQEIISKEHRAMYEKNVVIHASNLPKGRGWSPYIWAVLLGQITFPVTLLEAEDKVDSGVIYLQEPVTLEGHELLDEIRAKVGAAAVRACTKFLEAFLVLRGKPQEGEPSYCPRRGPEHSEIDPTKPLADQFDLLRCVDNERFPAWFEHRGNSYMLAITKDERAHDFCCGD